MEKMKTHVDKLVGQTFQGQMAPSRQSREHCGEPLAGLLSAEDDVVLFMVGAEDMLLHSLKEDIGRLVEAHFQDTLEGSRRDVGAGL